MFGGFYSGTCRDLRLRQPAAGSPGIRAFQAGGYWKFNVCGAVVGAVGGSAFLMIVGGLLAWENGYGRSRLWGVGLILFAIAGLLVLLWGNLRALFPYAVEVEEGKGFRFYGPFQQLYIPTQQVRDVKWSWLWMGWMVSLRQTRGLLPGFIIHAAWGQQGRDLAQAIREALAPTA